MNKVLCGFFIHQTSFFNQVSELLQSITLPITHVDLSLMRKLYVDSFIKYISTLDFRLSVFEEHDKFNIVPLHFQLKKKYTRKCFKSIEKHIFIQFIKRQSIPFLRSPSDYIYITICNFICNDRESVNTLVFLNKCFVNLFLTKHSF